MSLLPPPGVLDDVLMTAAPHNVVVVAFDGLQLLDLAGPVEVLRTATRLGASPPYRTMVATPDGQPVRSCVLRAGVLVRGMVLSCSFGAGAVPPRTGEEIPPRPGEFTIRYDCIISCRREIYSQI